MLPIFVSKRAINMNRIEKVICTEELIIVFSGFELKKDLQDFDSHFLPMEINQLQNLFPKIDFVPKMQKGDIFVYIKGTDSFTMIDRTPNFGVNNETFAHNQGKMSLELLTWAKYEPEVKFWLVGIVLLFLLTLGISFLFVIPLIIVGIMFYTKFTKKQSKFRSGDCNPGIVVALNPTLIAVPTDFTKGFGKFPIIKITETPLTQVNKQDLKIGDRLATVALYSGYMSNEIPHWNDFYPEPINIGVTNPESIDAVFSRFHEDDWTELNQRISNLEKPYRVGTFKVLTELNNWNESPISQLGTSTN
jgi:Protein of unknown function (DUF3239)